MTTSWFISHTRRTRRGPIFIAFLIALVTALPGAGATHNRQETSIRLIEGAPARARANRQPATHVTRVAPTYRYTWPLRPFQLQHPVRAFFGDPRIGPGHHGLEHSFHFGIDIHGADGSPVYATINGRVVLESFRPETVTVVADDGRTEFEYWHVTPHVRNGQRAVANRTVVGHISRWQHVHFSEVHYGRYVNPLRPGALGPYIDHTRPFSRDFRVERGGHGVPSGRTSGVVDFVIEAFDPAPTTLPEPWTGNPVTPARVQWRLARNAEPVTAWHLVSDFRRGIPPNEDFNSVYARWTRQNKRARTGRYRFFLQHAWDSRMVPDGQYLIEVAASDTRGNTGVARFPIVVDNQG